MKRILALIFPVLIFVASGCGPTGPAEEEVKSLLVGEYCGEGLHKLVIREDGTYTNQRTVKSAFTGAPILEKCEGAYSLLNEGGSWAIDFRSGEEKTSIMVKCEAKKITVWEKEGGYVVGDSLPAFEDLLDGVMVKKNDCL